MNALGPALRIIHERVTSWIANSHSGGGLFRNAVNPSMGASGETSMFRTILKSPPPEYEFADTLWWSMNNARLPLSRLLDGVFNGDGTSEMEEPSPRTRVRKPPTLPVHG